MLALLFHFESARQLRKVITKNTLKNLQDTASLGSHNACRGRDASIPLACDDSVTSQCCGFI